MALPTSHESRRARNTDRPRACSNHVPMNSGTQGVGESGSEGRMRTVEAPLSAARYGRLSSGVASYSADKEVPLISIVVKFNVRPDCSDEWIERIHDFTVATRGEAGNLWFEWSRNVEIPISSFSSKDSSTLRPARRMSTQSTSKKQYGRHRQCWSRPLRSSIPRSRGQNGLSWRR
jgi:hypothetical protein